MSEENSGMSITVGPDGLWVIRGDAGQGEPFDLPPTICVGLTFDAEQFARIDDPALTEFDLSRDEDGDNTDIDAEIYRSDRMAEISLRIEHYSVETMIDPEVVVGGRGASVEEAVREAEIQLRGLYDRGMAALHDLRARLKEAGNG